MSILGLIAAFGGGVFAGGVAAAAYAKKKGVSENGADIVSALAGLNEPDVRLVFGGKFKTGSEFMSKGKNFTTTLVIAFSYSLVVAGLYAAAVSAGVSLFFSTLVPFSKVPYIFP